MTHDHSPILMHEGADGTEELKPLSNEAKHAAHRRKIKSRQTADHAWDAGPYGTCNRCGTSPEIAFDKAHHPINI